MADKKITDLTAMVTPTDTDVFPTVQSGETKQQTALQTHNYQTAKMDSYTQQTLLEDANKFWVRDGTDNKYVTSQNILKYIAQNIYNEPKYKNLDVKPNAANPAYQYDIDADHFYIGGVKQTSINLTIDITVSGELGLDTGSEATSTVYYIYLISKEDGTLSAVFSIDEAAPTLPSGYVYYEFAGFAYNDGSGDFSAYRQINDTALMGVNILSGGTATSATAVALTGCPDVSRIRGIAGSFTLQDNSNLSNTTIAADTSYSLDYTRLSVVTIGVAHNGRFDIRPIENNIYYFNASATTTLSLDVRKIHLLI